MRLFISYAHVDRPLVAQLVSILRAGGCDPWFDHRLLPGQDWQAELLRAIRACDGFVYALTPESVASEWCRWEFAEAVKLGKPVVPVLLQAGTQLPDALIRLQYADFSDGATPEAVAALMGGLTRIAVRLKPGDVPPAPSQPRGVPAQAQPPAPDRLPFEPETVLIPAGPFLMGSDPAKDPNAIENEQPQHTVTLPDYRIGRYPVTVGEYRAFVEAGGYRERRWWTDAGWRVRGKESWTAPRYWDDKKWTGDDRLPVVGVSWYEAYAYCRWLAAQTGRTYRLPTEAEWEKAARGPDGQIYPWGDAWRDGLCNTWEAKIKRTTPVGQYYPADSPYGVADMAGNVWEWCMTKWRGGYQKAPDDDPDGDFARVLRGGSWGYDFHRARCAVRNIYNPHYWNYHFGFRCVCAVPSDPA
ncbi:MAG: SUMF1/EgtB/PvdO family nonheme iron enzyme [Anaerolineae bacterium]|nr:SUMF1/EgtB/PvdO family nonheme iron enzyme [Anaerolineae bacterium]